jgi:phosphoglycolate phosphatase-like HAD superfamily hydrolase
MPLQRFIFDLDGVLTDTTEYYCQAWQRLTVEAAKVAGMYAVGLGPVERVGQADLVLPDLSGVSLPDILRRLTPVHSGG